MSQSLLIQRSYSYYGFSPGCIDTICGRNPFLFRGPIPTPFEIDGDEVDYFVAIPSYSEVLFLLRLRTKGDAMRSSQSLLIQRSYSYIPTLKAKHPATMSQSLLIQRSYSYAKIEFNRIPTIVESQSLLIQRSYSYGGITNE